MKRITSVILALLLMLGIFSGCTNQASTTGTGSEKATSQQNAATEKQTTTAAKKKAELNLLIGQPRLKDQYDKYLKQFAEKYNYKLDYNLDMPSDDTGGQILKAKLAAGDSIDVFNLHAVNDIPVYYKAGYLEDLSSQPFAGKLIDSAKNAVTIDGKVVAVPLESLAWGYLYNKKIFAQLGLKPAMTLSEMKDNVKKLQEAKITPFLLTYKDSWIPQLFLSLTAGGLANSKYPDFIKNMSEGKGSFAELKEMFDIIDLVNANGTEKPFDVGGDNGCADFASGKAAMWVQGPWFADSILKANKDFEFGVAPLPITDDTKATMINVSYSTSLAVLKNSNNRQVAIDFINYVLDDNDSSNFYQSLKFSPVAKQHTFKTYPWVDDAIAYVKDGKAYQDPPIPSAVKDEANKVLQSYCGKNTSKEDVVKALDKAWQDYLKINK